MEHLRVRVAERKRAYEIVIGLGLLNELGQRARRSLPEGAQRIVLISNRTVFDLYGTRAMVGLRTAGFKVSSWLMKDGENHKTFRSLERALEFLTEAKLDRNDAVVALGGGVVGDLAGFASAVYLRGLAYIQVPTTLLAQIDASVGGKTAVNSSAGKNLFGAFHQPCLVLIDTSTLATLPARELTSAWCEGIKQGAVGSRQLFDLTCQSISGWKADKPKFRDQRISRFIAAHCAFKARIVAGDERETVTRMDHRSRRILNFGHTIAHALELVTGYGRFRHGEAVGYGMLVAGELSKRLGILGASDLESLRAAIHLAGPLPPANDLRSNELIDALARDKKSVGGQMNWILLERLGRARIVKGNEIAPRLLRASLRAALQLTT